MKLLSLTYRTQLQTLPLQAGLYPACDGEMRERDIRI